MISTNYNFLILFTTIALSTNVYSQNITASSNSKLNNNTSVNSRHVAERACVNCATDFQSNPQTGFLPVVLGVIALKTALIVSVIFWAIVKYIFEKKDDDNVQGYGYSEPTSQYGAPQSMNDYGQDSQDSSSSHGWNRMDFSNYNNYHNLARSLGKYSSVGQLTSVVWKALEKFSSGTD